MVAERIAVLTDFGYEDPFVGIMKGVIDRIAPGTEVIDLAHGIPPGDIRRGALALWQAVEYFSPGTVFLTVIDPGVGSGRRALAMASGAQLFVGPDNGVFSFIMGPGWQAWELSDPSYQLGGGATFHGRDIFAPAAAHLCRGLPPESFGPCIGDPVVLPRPQLDAPQSGLLRGEVLYADRFGNLLTSLGRFEQAGDILHFRPWLEGLTSLMLQPTEALLELPDGLRLRLLRTFAEIPEGECAGIIGSSGLLELCAFNDSAARRLGLGPEAPISLHFEVVTP